MPNKMNDLKNTKMIYSFSDHEADQIIFENAIQDSDWRHFKGAGEFIDALESPWPALIIARELSLQHRIDIVNLIENLGFPLERVVLIGEGECPNRIRKMLVMKNVADYLSLPINPMELRAKIEICRHVGNQKNQQRTGLIEEVLYNDLTHTEFKILKVFLETKDWLADKKMIHDRAFYGRSLSSKAIDVHLSNLKKKLGRHDFELAHVGLKSYQIKPLVGSTSKDQRATAKPQVAPHL